MSRARKKKNSTCAPWSLGRTSESCRGTNEIGTAWELDGSVARHLASMRVGQVMKTYEANMQHKSSLRVTSSAETAGDIKDFVMFHILAKKCPHLTSSLLLLELHLAKKPSKTFGKKALLLLLTSSSPSSRNTLGKKPFSSF